ncbi:hypothetical protein BOTNAR_0077g00280 [Botryotinia narcissicola]|uniref:Uncharacterized protein n=1 Tax=Botryotinia narcissicola TaxID=278944 RepID=A0A4Z1IXT6_9HELO|nr:hypothetical protein BOTNAR_0077g00280 [Botryotinia narcissicola]
MSGSRHSIRVYSFFRDSNEDLTGPPPYNSAVPMVPTNSPTGGAKPMSDFSDLNTNMNSKSSEASSSNVPQKKIQDAPKTEWKNKECRKWLEDYFVTMCGYKTPVAVEKASNFMGSGMSMYMMSFAEWKTLMGVCEGSGIYGVLMEHNKDGRYCFHSYNTRKNGSLYY